MIKLELFTCKNLVMEELSAILETAFENLAQILRDRWIWLPDSIYNNVQARYNPLTTNRIYPQTLRAVG